MGPYTIYQIEALIYGLIEALSGPIYQIEAQIHANLIPYQKNRGQQYIPTIHHIPKYPPQPGPYTK